MVRQIHSKRILTRKKNPLLTAYRTALSRYVKEGTDARLQPAQRLGRRALGGGWTTVDLVRMHATAVGSAVDALPVARTATGMKLLARRAQRFLLHTVRPMEVTHHRAMKAAVRLRMLHKTLAQRTRELSASKQKLRQEIVRHMDVKKSLRTTERRSNALLLQARQMEKQLRHLSRQILFAQEEERKRVSRELHDVVAQMLTSINARLAALKKEAAVSTKGIRRKISDTQRLVAQSVDIVHRFARVLRPAVLDDLGLLPALNSYLKNFAKETGIRVHLTASNGIEALSNVKRTALFRVAQEALANVTSHAQASRVDVTVERLPRAVRMSIHDNGKSFEADRMSRTGWGNHLGLLGMRERLEMVGGAFAIESVAGHGTTIHAQVPLHNGGRGPQRS